MFTLWYSFLSWREYRDVILDKFSQSTPHKEAPACPLPPKKEQPTPVEQKSPPSNIPIPQKTPPKPPSPQPQPPAKSPTPPQPKPPSPAVSPQPKSPSPIVPKVPPPVPPKPPRSPSPHPIRGEFEDIEYEDDGSEDDYDSVADSKLHWDQPKKPLDPKSAANAFLNQEISSNQKNAVGANLRDVILDKFSQSTPHKEAPACPLPPKKEQPTPVEQKSPPSNIPIPQKTPPKPPSPQPQPPAKSPTPPQPKPPSPAVSPQPKSPSPIVPKVPPPVPPKPPRSPSPHPIRGEFEDIEYEDDGSEDDYDSVADSKLHWDQPKKPLDPKSAANAFLNQEISSNQKNAVGANLRKSNAMVDAAVLEKLESGFKKLEASDSKSLLKKYLTREIFDNLKTKKTSFGSTLLDVIQSGLENHDSGVGIYAPDAESYTVFADLFDPIIEDYHGGFKKTDKHPPKNWGDVNTFGNLDPTGEYVISTRVRCGRSMEGYPFNPCLTEEQYKEMEKKVSSTLSGLEGELKGTFYPLTGMTKEVQQKLIDDHFLFKEGDRFLQAANACRFWPSGRGIYHNDAKTFLVWCNEEDHLRIISMQMGGDLGQVFRRLVSGVNDIEKRVPFSHNDRLGFLTFCPTNLGTTVRASVHIKVPKLAANKAKLEEVAGKYNLQVRGTRGEHTEAEGGVYDISNKRRMGLTEYDAVKEMYDGISELIKIEKEL